MSYSWLWPCLALLVGALWALWLICRPARSRESAGEKRKEMGRIEREYCQPKEQDRKSWPQ